MKNYKLPTTIGLTLKLGIDCLKECIAMPELYRIHDGCYLWYSHLESKARIGLPGSIITRRFNIAFKDIEDFDNYTLNESNMYKLFSIQDIGKFIALNRIRAHCVAQAWYNFHNLDYKFSHCPDWIFSILKHAEKEFQYDMYDISSKKSLKGLTKLSEYLIDKGVWIYL